MPFHSWEEPEGVQPSAHAWESAGDDEMHPAPDDSDALSDGDDRDPGDDFVEYCTELLLARELTSTAFCSLMFYAGRAGIDQAKKLGMKPGSHSGNEQRKVNAHIGRAQDRSEMYLLQMPCFDKKSLARTVRQIPVFVPHEQLDTDVDSNLRKKLVDAIDGDQLPPCYYDHPVVRAHGSREDPVRPLCLYLDGVPYSHTDSVIGIWLEDFVDGRRYIISVVRKKLLCRCGCRGWCSMSVLFSFLRWTCESMAAKKFPNARHDGTAWLDSDGHRNDRLGADLSFRSCVLFIKGDWAEYATTLGLPTWNDSVRPCYMCNCFGDGMYNHAGSSAAGFPHRENLEHEYDQSCDRCEIAIDLTPAIRQSVLEQGKLRYDKRASGSHGRALENDVPFLNLQKYDRLEPSADLPDIACFETLDLSTPKRVIFWRTSRETLTRHRNPLFSVQLGITVWRSLTSDLLHTLYLGVFHSFCRMAVWALILSGAWGGHGTQDEFVEIAVLVFRNALSNWYNAKAHESPPNFFTRISDVTRKMVGDPSDKKLKTKGAETWGLLCFLVDELPLHRARLGADGPILIEAARCLKGLADLFDSSGVLPSAADQASMWRHYLRFCDVTRGVPELLLPKRHMILHILRRLPFFGNPRFYAAWRDESLNKTLKGCCRKVSQATFEISVLSNMKRLLQIRTVDRKRPAALDS